MGMHVAAHKMRIQSLVTVQKRSNCGAGSFLDFGCASDDTLSVVVIHIPNACHNVLPGKKMSLTHGDGCGVSL